MRLLQLGTNDELTLTEDLKHDIPQYAILSHTWGNLYDEVTFQDVMGKTGKNKLGYGKIVFCGKQARADNLEYFWVDTCCIDKTDPNELSESINLMFNWYRNASMCYVYLVDVSRDECSSGEISGATWQQHFQRCKWFSRGWTLQELISPSSVRFYDQDGSPLGDKEILKHQICDITGITEPALLGTPLPHFRLSERYDWARKRQTTRAEDWAYSLQGIFGVVLPPNYGEGRPNAVCRLVREIKETQLGDRTQSFIIDNAERGRIVNPLFLDIALLQTMSLFDEARAEDQHFRFNIYDNATRLLKNDMLVSDTVSIFITFLYGLLRYVFTPITGLVKLERELDLTSAILRNTIASTREIFLDLQKNEENESSALRELEILKQYVGLTTLEMKEVEKEILPNTKEAGIILQHDEKVAKLREQITKLDDECYQVRQQLELTLEQMKAQRTETNDKVDKFLAKMEKAERIRREYENKNFLQKIWAWIIWLGSCGSDD